MRLTNNLKIILLLAITIGVVALVYYVNYERGKRTSLNSAHTQIPAPTSATSSLQATPNLTPTPTPQVEKDETARWKTYRNKKDGYEIKYPEDITEGVPSVVVTDTSDNLLSKCPSNDDPGPLKTEGKKTTINNITYCENIDGNGAAGSWFESFTYRTIKDKKLYTISFSAIQFYDCTFFEGQKQKDCEKSNENKGRVIDQVLSTFKFIK